MKHLLPLLLCLAIATSSAAQEAQYDEKMGTPGYPYKSYKEFIPVIITRLADTSIVRRNCGKEDGLEQKGYRFFNLCIYAQDHYYAYLRQSEEDGRYSVLTKDRTLHKPDKSEEMRDWFLKKKNGLPVSYAASSRVAKDVTQYFIFPVALKSSRNEAAKGFLNYGIRIDHEISQGTTTGLISYTIYPLHHPQDFADGKEVRGFPDYIALLQYILGTSGEDNYARIKSNYERKGDYHLTVHSPDVPAAWVKFVSNRAVVLLNFLPQEGTLTERFETLATELKSARWPVPFTAKLSDDEDERSYQFAAAGYPLTFSLIYRKRKGLLYLKVEPS